MAYDCPDEREREKTGYPTQKPAEILRRIVRASSNPGDLVLDFFAGSGTTGAVCAEERRNCILVNKNPEAIEIMRKRIPGAEFCPFGSIGAGEASEPETADRNGKC